MFEHVHISRGNTKLGADIPSVNLPPVVTCRPDAPCIARCYARHGRFVFPRNKSLLDRNLAIWQSEPRQYERDVIIAAYHTKFFRWHSSGDIPDAKYLLMMVRVASALPDTRFLCFTKKHELVNAFINEHGNLPENLVMVFSVWGDWLPDNPHHLPLAYIRFKKSENKIPAHAHPCPRFCGDCVMSGASCWDLKRNADSPNHVDCVVFDEH